MLQYHSEVKQITMCGVTLEIRSKVNQSEDVISWMDEQKILLEDGKQVRRDR